MKRTLRCTAKACTRHACDGARRFLWRMGATSPMGERKDAIPLRRRQALKMRAAVALVALLGAVAYCLGGAGASDEDGSGGGSGGGRQAPRRASSAAHTAGTSGGGGAGDDAEDQSSYDGGRDETGDAGHDDVLGDGSGGGGGAPRVRPSMSIPEFAFAGTWAPSKAAATIVEAQEVGLERRGGGRGRVRGRGLRARARARTPPSAARRHRYPPRFIRPSSSLPACHQPASTRHSNFSHLPLPPSFSASTHIIVTKSPPPSTKNSRIINNVTNRERERERERAVACNAVRCIAFHHHLTCLNACSGASTNDVCRRR